MTSDTTRHSPQTRKLEKCRKAALVWYIVVVVGEEKSRKYEKEKGGWQG